MAVELLEAGVAAPAAEARVTAADQATGTQATGTQATGTQATGTRVTGTRATGTRVKGTKAKGRATGRNDRSGTMFAQGEDATFPGFVGHVRT